jgi:hypothetical protein
MNNKAYIAGPISGIANNNIEAFEAVALLVAAEGLTPIVPHRLFDGIDTEDFSWEDYMRGCIGELVRCTSMVLLPGWEASRGACIERQLAVYLGMPITAAETLIHKNKP